MNPRSTGILFLVAAGLGAFVYFYVIRGEEARLEAKEQQKRLFPGVASEEVEWIALTTSDGRQVRAERRGEGWEIVEPLAFPGDEFALDGMASALAEASSEVVYEAPQPLEVYGLDDQSGEVRFQAGGEEHALRTGDKTPIGGNSYVSVVGREAVYAVPSYRVNSLRKSFDDLRDKRILRFDTSAVERIAATWPEGGVELARGDEGWRLTAPLEGPADEETVKDLLSDLAFLRAGGFEDESPPDAETGLDRPAYAVELALAAEEEGGEARSVSLAVGSTPIGEWRLVRAARPSLYRIRAERLDDFPRNLIDYRFKKLADFKALDAERVELGFSSAAGESVAITAVREAGAWRAEPEPMAPAKISRLVDELSKLRAKDILAERAGPEELRDLELDPPNLTLLVYGKREDEDAEAPRLAEVRIGALRGSQGIVAQSGESAQVFQLDLGLAEHIPVSLEAFRNRFLEEEEVEAPDEAADPDAEDSP